VWAGGRLGRVARHVAVWSRGRGEDWAASVARRREAVRRTEASSEPAEPAAEAMPAPSLAEPAASYADEAVDVAAPVRQVDAVEFDVPEVESLLRRAAERERDSLPHEPGVPPDEEYPPFGRNSRDS
jgi:hypothetical protein